jgi:hypothetical protein
MADAYLEATRDAGRAFMQRGITGPVVMLNLLRFRELADYAAHPALAPPAPIRGVEAYRRYLAHARAFLEARGGGLDFLGKGGPYLIGPAADRWDAAMLVRHRSVADFASFANDPAYLAGIGHRMAALEDSRLLPLVAGDEASVLG